MPRRKVPTPTLHPTKLNISPAVIDNAVQDRLSNAERARAFIRHSHHRHHYLQDFADQCALTLTELYEIAVDEFILSRIAILPPPRHLHRQTHATASQHILKAIPKKPKPKKRKPHSRPQESKHTETPPLTES
jgi:hypothetical protein